MNGDLEIAWRQYATIITIIIKRLITKIKSYGEEPPTATWYGHSGEYIREKFGVDVTRRE